ncbi:XRE family transcriptional regulator [Apibacter muscae]|uniref:XRE family transcriptional regulator n=1 Tax=Apibacter muscae TaxID=2509004 RepID=A0A563DEV5_9FLAO|nr:helix-turn-helix transcriptional regulator [Apibacter muscae]TWP28463.1 XRE family transcriptional regulator [Apibacter muscae]
MTVKERLIKFINYKNISIRSFESSIGVSHSYVSNIRVSIQPDKLISISKQYPDLNTSWLMTGEGEMLKIKNENIDNKLTINDRLEKYLDYKNIPPEEFRSLMDLSDNNIDALESKFPDFNINWLFTGRGEMLNKGDNSQSKKEFNYNNISNVEHFKNKNGNKIMITDDGRYYITVPLVEFSVYAGKINEYQEAIMSKSFEKEETFPADHFPKGNYLAFKVSGYSMDDGKLEDTPDGALVLGRELNKSHWKDGFYESTYGWIIISTKGMMFKDIVGFDKEECTITLHSRNQSPEFSDFTLKLDEVFQIFKVVKRTF